MNCFVRFTLLRCCGIFLSILMQIALYCIPCDDESSTLSLRECVAFVAIYNKTLQWNRQLKGEF
ncbi:hypothetical protein [Helicobacter rodentium]|nr:hypothetical protein [Helicobacter rodentium]